jgi:hypothetical protein
MVDSYLLHMMENKIAVYDTSERSSPFPNHISALPLSLLLGISPNQALNLELTLTITKP